MRDRANEPRIRINDGITVPQVRLIDEKGQQLGIKPIRFAQEYAAEHNLDLVEVAAQADPPVCRVMDYGKFRYDESIKHKRARQQAMAHNKPVKEIKFHANVAEHDFETKVRHLRDFLDRGHKVRLTLQFRGRENAHRELGMTVIQRVMKACEDLSVVEMEPKMMGRSLVAQLGLRPGGRMQPKKLDVAASLG